MSNSVSLGCGNESCQDPFCSSILSLKSFDRDDTVESSIMSVSNSMASLVNGAKEVRRMIREASFDSLISDYSLELNEDIGMGTEHALERIQGDVAQVRDNCGDISDNVATTCLVVPSKSDYSLTAALSPVPSILEGSTPGKF